MAAQADSTAGFVGEVSTAETPAVFGHGSRYSVESAAALKVTAAGAGDRALTVASGTAWGDAVLATWGSSTVLNATAGTRWDTLAIERDWSAETATLVLLAGGTSKALAPGVVLRNPAAATGAGYTIAHQPIALIRVASGQTAVQEIVDLRCWAGDGGLYAEAVEALQYLTEVGTQVRIGDVLHTRVIDGSGSAAWSAADVVHPAPRYGKFHDYAPQNTGNKNSHTRTYHLVVPAMPFARLMNVAASVDVNVPRGSKWRARLQLSSAGPISSFGSGSNMQSAYLWTSDEGTQRQSATLSFAATLAADTTYYVGLWLEKQSGDAITVYDTVGRTIDASWIEVRPGNEW